MSMHNEAERLRVLAETLDPPFEQRPYSNSPEAEAYLAWIKRYKQFNAALAIATPGALLGAAVDLFNFALAPKGWRLHLHQRPFDDEWHATIETPQQAPFAPADWRTISRCRPTPAAALIAAMEEVEI